MSAHHRQLIRYSLDHLQFLEEQILKLDKDIAAKIREAQMEPQWQETSAGWTCRHFVSVYRALLRDELTAILQQAGFIELRWLMPAESGFYQPLVLARHAMAVQTASSH